MVKKIIKALEKAGLTEYEVCTICNGDNKRHGIMVKHDYYGLYPGDEQFTKSNKARRIANRYGLHSEPRGYYTATLIYC